MACRVWLKSQARVQRSADVKSRSRFRVVTCPDDLPQLTEEPRYLRDVSCSVLPSRDALAPGRVRQPRSGYAQRRQDSRGGHRARKPAPQTAAEASTAAAAWTVRLPAASGDEGYWNLAHHLYALLLAPEVVGVLSTPLDIYSIPACARADPMAPLLPPARRTLRLHSHYRGRLIKLQACATSSIPGGL